jgi:hypothetical protein
MDLFTDLVDQIDGHLTHVNHRSLTVVCEQQQFQLLGARCGSDFLFGFSDGSMVALPHSAIRCLTGGCPPEIEGLSLADFLAAQKVPVRLIYQIGGVRQTSWLLNVTPPWLRIGTSLGVEWIPISAVEYARIQASTQQDQGSDRC